MFFTHIMQQENSCHSLCKQTSDVFSPRCLVASSVLLDKKSSRRSSNKNRTHGNLRKRKGTVFYRDPILEWNVFLPVRRSRGIEWTNPRWQSRPAQSRNLGSSMNRCTIPQCIVYFLDMFLTIVSFMNSAKTTDIGIVQWLNWLIITIAAVQMVFAPLN